MAIFRCKMCGADLSVGEGATIVQCDSCGTNQTVPTVRDENVQGLFNRANLLRRKSEFDKAEQIYEKIVQMDGTQAEAYWGLILCKYGIEYVEDPITFRRVPTCHRTSLESIIADEDYMAALEYADVLQRQIYEAEAKEIDRLQKEIIALSQKEEPYDVFICYKETGEDGKRTRDSVLANDIYHQLTREGLKVFYAAITLEDKLGSAYEPCIFGALNSAKVMLAVGTRPEYFTAVWVKNEWSRFLKMMKKDRSKLLIPCYLNMDPYELPEEFAHLQAQDMSKIGFINDVVRGIKKVSVTESSRPASKATPQNGQANSSQLMLEDDTMYEGETFAGIPHGFGKAIYVNGDVYEGNWNRGKRNGQGKLTWNAGGEWVGEYVDDKRWNGTGVEYVKIDGNVYRYDGELRAGVRHGYGTLQFADSIYEGQWVEGKQHGQGKLTWNAGGEWVGEYKDGKRWNGTGVEYVKKDGNVYRYDGELRAGVRHGFGTFQYDNGVYEGQWADDKRNGPGKMIWNDGSETVCEFKDDLCWNGKGTTYIKIQNAMYRYDGEIRNGVRHGYGKIEYSDCFYEGQWENDKRSGQGKLTWKQGGEWIGEYKNNQRFNGKGVVYYTSGTITLRYDGEIRNGVRHGYGRIEYGDSIYEGCWENDQCNGQGKMIWNAGGEWIGEFKHQTPWNGHGVWYFEAVFVKQKERYEGEIREGARHGYGKCRYANGVYEGQWANGKSNGQGKMIWNDGGEWVGTFKDGEPWNGKGFWKIDGQMKKGRYLLGKWIGSLI